ncbi:MAG: hypothetical protein IPP35_00885 [Elusimicrobia bacterium]|nr:hypothetical protein [Elusimicrobiota bacterium]
MTQLPGKLFSAGVLVLAMGIFPGSLRAGSAQVSLDFDHLSPSGGTFFGSNMDIYDNRHPEKHLDGERLLDRSFEWSQNQVWVSTWIGGAAGSMSRVTSEAYGGKASLRAAVSTLPPGSVAALIVAGVWVNPGETYRFSMWTKSSTFGGGVKVSLLDTVSFSPLAAPVTVSGTGAVWTRSQADFSVTGSTSNAFLVLQFLSTGTVWVDQLSLVPAGAGIPGEPLDGALDRVHLKFMRFPAGSEANAYDWSKAIGPRDTREATVPVQAYYTANAGAGFDKQPYANDVGVDEFLQMCERKGWTPLLTVNVASGPAHAANWVEYCNGDGGTFWGSRRAANGRSAPYHVTYWEVGNELWNQEAPEPGAQAHANGYTQGNTDNYISVFQSFAAAMKAKDPSILVGAVGGAKPSDSIVAGFVDPDWDADLLTGAGPRMDFIASHYYAPGPDAGNPSFSVVAQVLAAAPFYFESEMAALSAAAPASVQRTVTEYGVSPASTATADDTALGQTWAAGLYWAGMQNAFLRQKISFATQHDLLNESGSLLMNTSDAAGRHIVVERVPSLVLGLYAENRKSALLNPTTSVATFSSPAIGWMSAQTNVPLLDVAASADPATGDVSVFVVNRSPTEDISTAIRFDHFPGWVRCLGGDVLSGPSLDAKNTPADPLAIVRRPVPVSDVSATSTAADSFRSFQSLFGKASVSILRFSYADPKVSGDAPVAFPVPFDPAKGSPLSVAPVAEGAEPQLFSMDGRLVRKLPAAVGGRSLWDGTNAEGRLVASGVYLLRIESAGKHWTKKIIVQR